MDGGTYTSHGTGSPAVYCTADILISNAVLAATNSEAVCIEGLNSLTLNDCELSGNIPKNEQNDCDWTVILYQSMSGDSEIGNSVTVLGTDETCYVSGTSAYIVTVTTFTAAK